MAQVIGLGGVFLKFKDPANMRTWYHEVLGMTTNDYGVLFEFNIPSSSPGHLQLGTFEASSGYFGDPSQQVMLNFRVDDLEAFEPQLRSQGVKIVDKIESYDYGKFLHIEDPEGNRIELWEPVDVGFGENPESTMPMK